MGNIVQLLVIGTILLTVTDGCIMGSRNMCNSGTPLMFGGRIQLLPRDGGLVDPFWNNEGRRFVFLVPPGGRRNGGGLRGARGVIVINEGAGRCSRGNGQCPMPATDVPCEMPSANYLDEPLVFSNITSTGVMVTWDALDEKARQRNPPITWYALNIREVGSEENLPSVPVSSGAFHRARELTPDTLYQFQLVPMSEDVTEVISPLRNQTMRTLCGVPSTPSFLESSTTSRSVTFDIIPLTPDDWQCSDLTTTLQVLNDYVWEDIRPIENSATSVVVDGLTPCTSYSYRLKLSNLHETTHSDAQDITTDEEAPGEITSASSESTSPQTLNVSWTPPDMSDTACEVVSYRIQYSLVGHMSCPLDEQPADEAHQVVYTEGDITSIPLVWLEHYAEYNISITPLVAAPGGSTEGEAVSLIGSTSTAAPSEAPREVILKGVAKTQLTFQWRPPPCTAQNGVITGYSYVIADNSGEMSNSGTVDTTSVKISDLDQDTEYTFKVAALTSAGIGPYSSPVKETTRSRGNECSGKQPLQVGGMLSSLTGDTPPWGSGQPIFIVPHHLRSRNGRRTGPPFRPGGIIRIKRSTQSPCSGSSGAANCPTPPEITESMDVCPLAGSADENCGAAYPRFSYDREDVMSFVRLDRTEVKVTWRDWSLTKDRGVGPVTGYLLRYRRRHQRIEPVIEIPKGMSLYHELFNLTANADYEFEVVALEGEGRMEIIQPRAMDAELPVLYRTGCGELDPVPNLTVTNNGEYGTLVVSWDTPIGFCTVQYYEYVYGELSMKACPDEGGERHFSPRGPFNTTETNITLNYLGDYTEYNISIIPVTLDPEGGYLNGEERSIVGTTSENAPTRTPTPTLTTTRPTSVVISWSNLSCWEMAGEFTMYSYILRQSWEYDGLEIKGTTTENSVEIKGLIAYAEFTFELQIHSTGGAAPVNIINGRTEPSTELFHWNLTVLVTENVTSSTVALSWRAWDPEIDNGTGTVQSYIIRVSQDDMVIDIIDAGLNLSVTVDGLDFDTMYDFRFFIVARGPGPGVRGLISDPHLVRTHCAVPSRPGLELKLLPKTELLNKVILKLQIPGEAGWRCRNLAAHLQKEEDGEWTNDGEQLINDYMKGTETDYYEDFVQREDLVPCSEVAYRVQLINDHHTVYSEPLRFTTLGKLSNVRNLTVTETEEPGELFVDWEVPEVINNCPMRSYIVEYNLFGTPACQRNIKQYIDSIIVNETQARIPDLEPFRHYTIEVTPILTGYAGNVPEKVYGLGLTRGHEPIGILNPVVGINASSIRELKFSWRELPCETHNGPNLTYLCELYLTNGRRHILEDSMVADSETCTFENLKACGNYSFRVTPGNDYGLGNVSHEVTARISATALGPVENISTVVLPEGVAVRWERDEVSGLCPVAGYKLNYMLQRQQACRYCIDEVQSPVYTNGTSYLIENLRAFSTYKINISVQLDEQGSVGLVLREKIFTSKSTAPTEAPVVRVDTSLSKSQSLTFKWNPINCTALNGIFKQYTFKSNGTKGEIGISNRRRRSRTLPNLIPCTTYQFQIRVVNSIGGGPFGSAFGTTAIGKPGRDFSLSSETRDDKTVILHWQRSAQNPCPIDHYVIGALLTDDLCEEVIPRGHEREEMTLAGTVTSVRLEEILMNGNNLKAWSIYQVTLRARNSIGDGEEDFLEVKTPELAPSGSPGAIAQVMGTISWSEVPCKERNGVIVGYEFALGGDGIVRTDVSTRKEVTPPGLMAGSTYSFKVRAGTLAGYGPWSEEVHFQVNE